jgi:MFS transporter, DHA1 family, multidrug resistance protein
MKIQTLPSLWLIFIIVGLPQLSETVYTPSLPDIAHALKVSENWVEYTLTVYLTGFAFGTLFWGILSDKYGRKPCLIAGLILYILGCIVCYFSTSITLLLISRFIQAFGGSVGSVLGQAICRDSFKGPALSQVYASIGGILALSPALGPIIGGFIAEHFGWSFIFLFLMGVGFFITLNVTVILKETLLKSQSLPKLGSIFLSLFWDKKVLAFGFLVAACNGIQFSYYAEGSFYLIEQLGLTPTQYGFSFFIIALAAITGNHLAKKLYGYIDSTKVLKLGALITVISSFMFVFFITFVNSHADKFTTVSLTLGCMFFLVLGNQLIIPSALSQSLMNYKHCIGAASSLFGFYYYALIALFTLGMGYIHNGTLYPMPYYFLGLSLMICKVANYVGKK